MDANKRLASLDALRGFDMLFICGLASLITAICSLFPNGSESWLAQQMTHVDWNGLRHHDTIFPLFLFIAGISFPFSYAKQKAVGASKAQTCLKIVRRALLLVLFGFICNGLFKLQFEHFRFYSVLARIGMAWMFASFMFISFKPGTRAIIAGAILIGYWLLLRFVPAPDAPGADPFSFEGNLVGYIDRVLMPGHLYNDTFDPEGLLSLLPSIVTAMLGMFTGELVQAQGPSGGRKTLIMISAAVAMLILGLIWSRWFPINKKLWSSSFVLVVGAYSLAMFALFYWIIDVKGLDGWILPLRVVGMNSITIFMAPRIINFRYATDFFLKGVQDLCTPELGKVIWYAGYLTLIWLFLYFLYKKKIFLKI